MSWLMKRTSRRLAFAVAAYWDDVVRQQPATPVPAAEIPTSQGTLIRQLHTLEQHDPSTPSFQDELLQRLLTTYEETTPMNVTTTTAAPTKPRYRGTVPEHRRQAARFPFVPIRRYGMPVLEIAAIVLVLLATIGGFWLTSHGDDNIPAVVPGGGTPAASPAVSTATPATRATFDRARMQLAWQSTDDAGLSNLSCGMAVSPDGNIYVLDCLSNDIIVFSPTGKYLQTWGGRGTGPGQFAFDAGARATPNLSVSFADIDFDTTGNIYVFDSFNNRIQVFAPDHTYLREITTAGPGGDRLKFPMGMVDRVHDQIYVADYGSNRVFVLDLDGNLLRQWGESGTGKGQFNRVSAIALGLDGTVYVAEEGDLNVVGNWVTTGTQRIQRFSPDGAYLGLVGKAGDYGPVYSIAVDGKGNLLVPSLRDSRVNIYASNGTSLGSFTTVPGFGALSEPRYLALTDDGTLYIAGSFDRVGHLLRIDPAP